VASFLGVVASEIRSWRGSCFSHHELEGLVDRDVRKL
jgi:hypothetical protein